MPHSEGVNAQSISFRRRDKETGKWECIPLETFAGHTVAEVLTGCDGEEVVAEINYGQWTGYLCGTEKWLEYYKKKGSAKSFREGVEILTAKGSPLMGALCPGETETLAEVNDVFAGAEVESVEYGLF